MAIQAVYLDTHVVVWLAAGKTSQITPKAQALIETADLLLSPMALMELEYLYELKRIRLRGRDLFQKVAHETGLQLCDLPFPSIAGAALDEMWARDPFDRLIVAQAKANGFAPLLSADAEIRKHYPRTVW